MPAPQIFVKEIDFSYYLRSLVDFPIGIVSTASRGPVDTLTLLTSPSDVVNHFGDPGAYYQGVHAAIQFLKLGQICWFVRVAGSTKATATVTLKDSTSTDTVTLNAVEPGTWFDRLQVIVGSQGVNKKIYIKDSITGKYLESFSNVNEHNIELKMNGVSQFLTATKLPTGGLFHNGTFDVNDGNDGIDPTIQATVQIGTGNAGMLFTSVLVGDFGNAIKVALTHGSTAGFAIHNDTEITFTYTTGMTADELIDMIDTVWLPASPELTELITVDLPLTSDGSATLSPVSLTAMTGGVTAPNYVGYIEENMATGLQFFRNSEELDVYALACPGVTTPEVHSELIDICETRADCVAFLDIPHNLTVQDAVDFHNAIGKYMDRPILASSWAVIYYGWEQVYNGYNLQYEWIAPTCGALYTAANTVGNAELWSAMAGLQRGKLPWALTIDHSANPGERDYMYSVDTNSINPIVRFHGLGTAVWGQKTLSRSSSALDRLNVRYLLIWIRRAAKTLVSSLLFQPNDIITWREFVNIFEPFMDGLVRREGVYDFRVICDATTNTPEYIDNNTMRAKIFLKPTKTAEIIEIDLVLLRTGADFNEYIGSEALLETMGQSLGSH